MSNLLNIKRGLRLNIAGGIGSDDVDTVCVRSVAVTPDDFIGITPKAAVKEGDTVVQGAPLIFDKNNPDISLVSPVAGTVSAVVRGERRKLLRIVISADTAAKAPLSGEDYRDADAGTLIRVMQRSGVWAMMRQRPYDIVPVAGVTPRDIFVTLMDEAPLAPDTDVLLKGHEAQLEAAVKALAKLTPGKVYVCRSAGSRLADIRGAVNYTVSGPYPASNAGVQIDHISPVNKGDTVWTLDTQAMLLLGSVITGRPEYSGVVALTGAGIARPRYVRAPFGASIADLLANDIKHTGHHLRYISGNVLTGVNVGDDGFLRRPYTQVTVIAEGDDVDEFMGWASLNPAKMSISRSFPGHFMKSRMFNPDARLLGGRRAMIMSGEYDRVTPMDIMPEYLIKAILSHNIDRMEALGIYEVAPEDFAAAEYVDTSKLPLQQIVRDGLDYLRRELD